MNSPTRFLLLDINGLLCCKVPKGQKYKNYDKSDILKLNSYKVIIRPYCREFLEKCYSQFTIGFFTSTCEWNVKAILNKLLTPEQHKATVLMWFRDRTRFDPDTSHEVSGFDTIKVLDDIFQNPMVNEKRLYSEQNTVLIDDSETKTRFNDPANIIICKAFTGEENDQGLLDLLEIIPQKFEALTEFRLGPFDNYGPTKYSSKSITSSKKITKF